MDAAVAAAADEQTLAADYRDDRYRIISIFDRMAGVSPPNHFAGLLVEGDKAIAAHAEIAPSGVGHADNDQVAVNDRTRRTATVAGNAAVLFRQRVLPEDFTVFV